MTNLKWHRRGPQEASLQNYTPHTHKHGVTAVVHKGKPVIFLLALPTLIPNELCCSAQRITHQRRAPDGCIQSEHGKKIKRRNNKDSLMTQPPRGRKDLDWCILSSWQSLFYVRYEARLIGAVREPFHTVILEPVCCHHSYIMSACHHISIFEATSDEMQMIQ